MPKKLSIALLLVAALLLTGCGGTVVTDLYVQDILEVVEGAEEPLFTLATISVESPGDEYNQQVIGLIEGTFRDAANSRTMTQDYTTYVLSDVRVPIVDLDDFYQLWEDGDPIGIVVVDMEDGTSGFGLSLNSDVLDPLFAEFSEQLWEPISIANFTFTVRLLNDTRGVVAATVQGVYANQIPVSYEERFDLERRDVLEMKLGDVVRDAAYREGIAVLGVLE